MKLDKIRFARLISYITEQSWNRSRLTEVQIESIDELITFDPPMANVAYPQTHDVNELMALMAAGDRKIEAIKVHRKLTGWGLKESKDQVEKYWKSAPYPKDAAEHLADPRKQVPVDSVRNAN